MQALQPGCKAQKRSKHAEAARVSKNGSNSGQLEEDAPESEVANLQREVAELRGLVAAQGKLVKEQVDLYRLL